MKLAAKGLAAVVLFAAVAVASAADRGAPGPYSPVERPYSLGIGQYSYSFSPLPLLPRRYQNHCGLYYGHYICADHCGLDYQVYYCSKLASGCCHIGRGYCDDAGHLRCMPALF
jgi:hypothetical protein